MKFEELPVQMQEQLRSDRLALKTINTPYEIRVHNPEGTRFFEARRVQASWYDDKGHSLPFGGGSKWTIRYGVVAWKRVKDLLGSGFSVELTEGKLFNRSANGTAIPNSLATKKEVLALIQQIGIFKTL